jgi:glycosyltransferase involved in cell wall biosynthesis
MPRRGPRRVIRPPPRAASPVESEPDAVRHSPVRLIRLISRLNVGGPAIQAITLTKLLEPSGYTTTLVRGCEDPDEGSMDDLARQFGVSPLLVPSMRRNVGWRDALALPRIVGVLRRDRPQLVHTHAAKAGTLGRMAALLAFGRRDRPALVHTFHGHSLSGYFSSRRNALFLRIERLLARRTDRLIAVSAEVRDELVGMGVAPPEKFQVVPVGFDLERFQVNPAERARRRAAFRAELGISQAARVLTLVARLVPIKRVDRFLRVARGLADLPEVVFLVVGDGELREQLRGSEEARALGVRLVWAGLRRDIPDVCFASDVVMLTSDNEGTPVSLIEAQAAGLPTVGTRVGGVASVVIDGESGRLAAPDDETALGSCVRELIGDPERASAMGARGRDRVLAEFALDRLIADMDRVYQEVLTRAEENRR